MLRKNTKHQQPALISAISDLPEKQRKRLENSWAGTFYREFFCRIDESAFAVLYSEVDSRPNVPVGLEALKAGFGWSDQELNRLTICSSCWASPSPRSHLGTKRHARRGWEQHLSACVYVLVSNDNHRQSGRCA